ncbi:hypothetical protein GGR51DRAFT_560946 [Nemania sp. FL0031]|nr:hypothetical protein GGR51DRAFT_560946 [Nemania sp. FL0031]
MSSIHTPGENPAWRQIIINAVFNTITIIVVCMRLYSRRLTRAGLSWDDTFIILATVLVNCMLVAHGLLIDIGFGLPVHDLDPKQRSRIMKIGHGFRMEFLLCICFVKLSALFFYLRVFGSRVLHCNTISHSHPTDNDNGPSKFSLAGIRASLHLFWCFLRKPTMRLTYIFFIWVVFTWSLVNIGQELTVCGLEQPICPRMRYTDLSVCVYNSVSDLLIFFLPLWPIWRLQMNRNTKIGLSIVLLLGTVTVVVAFLRFEAIVHTDYASNYNATAMKSFNYAILEANLAILCISLPMLQPLIRMAWGTSSPCILWRLWARCFGGRSGGSNSTKSSGNSCLKDAHVNIELTVVSTRASCDEAAYAEEGRCRREESKDENRDEVKKGHQKGSSSRHFLSRAKTFWSVDSDRSSQDDMADLASRPGRRPTAGSIASSLNRDDWHFSPPTGVTITTITAGKK